MASLPYGAGVPTTTPDVRQPDDYQKIDAGPASFGGSIATGLEQFGQGASKAGKFWGQIQTDDAVNNAMEGMNGVLDKFRSLRGQDALNAQQDTYKQAKDIMDQAKAGLSTPEQQLQYDNLTRSFHQRYFSGIVASHADQQGKEFTTATNNAKIQVAMTGAANVAEDDAQVDMFAHMAGEGAVKNVIADGNAGDFQTVKAARDRAVAATYKTAAEVRAIRDPSGALTYIDKHRDQLGQFYAPLADQFKAAADKQIGLQAGQKALGAAAVPGREASPTGGRAPGANGYGTVNEQYTAPFNAPNSSGVAPNDLYSHLVAQGATPNEALLLTSAAASESGINPNAKHDFNGVSYNGYGLFGHNTGRLDLRGKDWQQQADMALNELRTRPEGSAVNAARTPEELAIAEMHYERPKGYTESNPQGGLNYTGRLNTLRYFAQSAGILPPTNPTTTQTAGSGKMTPYEIAHGFGSTPPGGPGAAPEGTPTVNAQSITPISTGGLTPTSTMPEGIVPVVSAAPPSVVAGRQGIKADAFQQINDQERSGTLNAAQADAARKHINDQIMAQDIAEATTEKQLKENAETRADYYGKQTLGGTATAQTFDQLLKDPAFERFPQLRQELGKAMLANVDEGVVAAAKHYGSGYWDAKRRILLPAGDPKRLSDVADIYREAGIRDDGMPGTLTMSGADKLVSMMQGVRKSVETSSVQHALTRWIDYAKPDISFDGEMSVPGLPPKVDPEGKKLFDQFAADLELGLDKAVAKGEDPHKYLSKENIDKVMAPYLRSKAQMKMDRIAAQPDQAEQPGTPLPTAPQGVDRGGWTGLMKTVPMHEDGTPFSHAKWGAALERLARDKDVTAWNKSAFGQAGWDGNEILQSMFPAVRKEVLDTGGAVTGTAAVTSTAPATGEPAPKAPTAAAAPTEHPSFEQQQDQLAKDISDWYAKQPNKPSNIPLGHAHAPDVGLAAVDLIKKLFASKDAPADLKAAIAKQLGHRAPGSIEGQ